MNRKEALGRLLAAWPLWTVVLACTALQIGGDPVRRALRYQRAAIAHGEWWRLFTGNFVHAGWTHLALDLAGVGLLWLLTGAALRGWRWLLATVAGAWAVGLGLWWAWPHLAWYVGISGVAHTYWAAGALLLIAAGSWEGWALLVLLAAKLAWEQASGGGLPTSHALLKEPVVTSAHLVGAIAGIVVGAVLLFPDLAARFAGAGSKMRERERTEE